jgi:hypothetical protein
MLLLAFVDVARSREEHCFAPGSIAPATVPSLAHFFHKAARQLPTRSRSHTSSSRNTESNANPYDQTPHAALRRISIASRCSDCARATSALPLLTTAYDDTPASSHLPTCYYHYLVVVPRSIDRRQIHMRDGQLHHSSPKPKLRHCMLRSTNQSQNQSHP